ncbi:hypothetical protein [Campylobacter sp.]|uniref:hypothetical protein n=1 Tax=Campylobacter sp. TaxID=205 RepID=UPI003FA16D4A
MKELVKFWLDGLSVLSAPKFHVTAFKIITKYFALFRGGDIAAASILFWWIGFD